MNQIFDHGPSGNIGGKHGHAQIDTRREVLALIVDHQRLVPLGCDLKGLTDHGKDLQVHRFHFAMHLETDYPIANIP